MLASRTASLASAELSPADVYILDIVEAAQRGCGGFAFVVREVHARLATRMRRAALIKGAPSLSHGQVCMHRLCARTSTRAVAGSASSHGGEQGERVLEMHQHLTWEGIVWRQEAMVTAFGRLK